MDASPRSLIVLFVQLAVCAERIEGSQRALAYGKWFKQRFVVLMENRGVGDSVSVDARATAFACLNDLALKVPGDRGSFTSCTRGRRTELAAICSPLRPDG